MVHPILVYSDIMLMSLSHLLTSVLMALERTVQLLSLLEKHCTMGCSKEAIRTVGSICFSIFAYSASNECII
uniref:Uncharacterized protein n=1 Tax=Arundo donax TaxID=35708 RepID=A0A0A9BV06_ARUDO